MIHYKHICVTVKTLVVLIALPMRRHHIHNLVAEPGIMNRCSSLLVYSLVQKFTRETPGIPSHFQSFMLLLSHQHEPVRASSFSSARAASLLHVVVSSQLLRLWCDVSECVTLVEDFSKQETLARRCRWT